MPDSADASRDLLPGLLALHNGLIDRDRLVSACRARAEGAGRSLVDTLVEQGALDEPRRVLLDALSEEHLRRHGGDPGRSLDALGSVPPTRVVLDEIDDPARDPGPVGADSDPSDITEVVGRGPTHGPSLGDPTSRGRRFRVLRPHARGGLGVVSLALDAELNREVALKQILDRHADDPESRRRFLVEAEVTGGLEHPGIVPVYGLGHDDDGRPYYAMRFIRGDSLKEAIESFHSEAGPGADPGRRTLGLRVLLRRFVDICNAVDYAHSRGVVHRDIKPANVIVGPHGETLVVDWGLAKPTGRDEPTGGPDPLPPWAGGPSQTLPGSLLGTPAFMSPEQAAGDLERVGPRSDVYSLGATLYCVATGRAPFGGVDLAAVLRAVREGDFPPPRSVDPSVDAALEAVCLKAMAVRPEDRYASPRELADDVERWAADEPVTSWREPMARRARRWARRHRTTAAAAVAATLAAMVGLAGVLAVQARANRDLADKNAMLVLANERVQARFDLAQEAIQAFRAAVDEDLLLREEGFRGLRDKLLRGAAGFHGKLRGLLQGQSDRRSREAMARASDELGELTARIGVRAEAMAVQRMALAVRRELAGSPGADPAAGLDVARSLLALGTLAREAGDAPGALAAFEEARALAQARARPPLATDAAREILATSLYRIGIVRATTGRPAEALESYGEALAIRRGLAEANPGAARIQADLAGTHNNIGLLLSEQGRAAEALEEFRQARRIQERLAEADPADVPLRADLAGSHVNIGKLLTEAGDWAGARQAFDRALAIRRELAEANPAVTRLQSELASSHNNLGNLLSRTGRVDEALASHRQALAIRRGLAEANPSVTQFRADLTRSHYNIGYSLWDQGRAAEALESFGRALGLQEGLAASNPSVTQFRADAANTHNNLGLLLSEQGRAAEALEAHRRALAIRQGLAGANPGLARLREEVARSRANIGDLLLRMGSPAGAAEEFGQAVAIRRALVEADSGATARREALAEGLSRLGAASLASGRVPEAVAALREAVAIQEKLARSADDRFLLACYRSSLAGACARPGSGSTEAEAAAEADLAMATLAGAVAPGVDGLALIRGTPELEALRPRPDFRAWLMDLAFPADPFAR